VERTRLLLHVVDASGQEGRAPWDDLKAVDLELSRYGDLGNRPQIVVANKMDLPSSREHLESLRESAGERPFFAVSAATGDGLEALLDLVVETLKKLPQSEPLPEEPFPEEPHLTGWEAKREEDGAFLVFGASMDSLLAAVNFDDYESLNWFHKTLRASGVIDRLREMGAMEGDTVRIGDMAFDFIE
jgi:GTP-binding protein